MKHVVLILTLGLFSSMPAFANKSAGDKIKEDAQEAKEAFVKFGQKANEVGGDIAEGSKKLAEDSKAALDKKKKK